MNPHDGWTDSVIGVTHSDKLFTLMRRRIVNKDSPSRVENRSYSQYIQTQHIPLEMRLRCLLDVNYMRQSSSLGWQRPNVQGHTRSDRTFVPRRLALKDAGEASKQSAMRTHWRRRDRPGLLRCAVCQCAAVDRLGRCVLWYVVVEVRCSPCLPGILDLE